MLLLQPLPRVVASLMWTRLAKTQAMRRQPVAKAAAPWARAVAQAQVVKQALAVKQAPVVRLAWAAISHHPIVTMMALLVRPAYLHRRTRG